jgi:hypothetical protein
MRKFTRLGLLFGFSCLAFALPGAAAQAAVPATVAVEVEGTSQTLLAPTSVTTTSTPVVKDGEHACSGGSAAGALELATSGKWSGEWFGGFGYSVETILGETHAFEPGAPANFFWSYWLNDKPSSAGICEGELSSNESILFFPECFSETGACPAAPNPLGIAAPTSAERGAPVNVTVTSFANANGEPSPAAGATVSGGGATATTDASGHATLVLTQTGNVQLQATAPQSVRSVTSVCVHSGSDGTCGTTGPSGSTATGTTVAAPEYKGPYAIVARAGGVIDGHVYARGRGPKVLSGAIATHAHVTAVELKLRRSYRGRCFAYDGKAERFKRAPCGVASFFDVGSSPSFSYLLPGALAPGRYVLDIEATDAAGNHTSLARGTSRIVFYVR